MCWTFLKLLQKHHRMSTCIRLTYLHLTSSVILSETTLSPRMLLAIQYIFWPLSCGITVYCNLDVILERKYWFVSVVTIVWSLYCHCTMWQLQVGGSNLFDMSGTLLFQNLERFDSDWWLQKWQELVKFFKIK